METSTMKYNHIDDTPNLSNVIDSDLYGNLDTESKNSLQQTVITELRPVGIEKELWLLLKSETKSKILKFINEDVLSSTNGICSIDIERPEEVGV